MGSAVGFFADESDRKALESFALSLGMHLLPMQLDREITNEVDDGPACYLSVVSRDELHAYGNPPVKIAEVMDPMLFFMRSYFKNPYLVLGQIIWNNDDDALAKITRPYYNKISTWIKKNWDVLPGVFYIGPNAKKLLELGAQTVNFPPDQPIEFKVVYVKDDGA